MAAALHRDTVRRLKVGAVTLVIGAAVAYIGITVQGGGALPLKSYTTVSAEFDDVGTLKLQQKVTQNGVRVGMITGIDYDDGLARVTIRLDGDHDVYRDATARIGNESALGKKYIDFDPGTSEAGDLGDAAIPAEQTEDAADLNDVLKAFPDRAREGLSTSLTELGAGFYGHGDDLNTTLGRAPVLLDDATVVLDTLADPATRLDDLLVQADDMATQFQGREEDLAALLDQTSTTMEALDVDDGTAIQSTIAQAPQTLRTARDGLAAINGPLRNTADAAKQLRPGVGKLVRATPDLRGFLTESPPVARTVQQFTKDAEPAVKSLVPAVADLRPVVQRLTRLVDVADPFLSGMRPWWPDVSGLAAQHNMLSGRFSETKHYFSAMLAFPGIYNVSIPDPTAQVNPYPGPGQAFENYPAEGNR